MKDMPKLLNPQMLQLFGKKVQEIFSEIVPLFNNIMSTKN